MTVYNNAAGTGCSRFPLAQPLRNNQACTTSEPKLYCHHEKRNRSKDLPQSTMLKHLKRVFVQFRPGDPLSVSARELLQRASTDSAKRSNPACKVEFKIDEESAEGAAFAELMFSDNDTRKILLASVGVDEIARMIERKASEMEMIAVLKEVGYDPWKAENRVDGRPAGTVKVKPEAMLSGEVEAIGKRIR